MSTDKAGKELWDQYWEEIDIPIAINPHETGFRNHMNRKFHEYFSQVFLNKKTLELKLLEIGCARSAWLPYFAKEFGCKISGLDYSEIGCEQSRKVLSNAGVDGDIICANFFAPPETLLNTFDVVFSYGVVEHFEDTVSCLSAFSKFLKPNGIIITNIPNMNGLNGLIFKLVNRPVYDTHVLGLDLNALAKAHEAAGFEVLNCDYFISVDFGIPNLVGLNPQHISTRIKGFFMQNLTRLGKAFWAIEERSVAFKSTQLLSPFIMLTGKKK